MKRAWIGATILACLCVNPYVRGDGNGYYAWLVSPVIDGDLDFTNQFQRADPLFQTLIFETDGRVRAEMLTPTGHVGNQWSVGPAVAWAPWFLVAHGGVLAARAAGAPIPADGYSWPYVWLVAVGTVVYGMLALWLSAGAAARLGYGTGVPLAVLGIGLASSLPVYQVFLPFHVHALAACAVAAFVAYGVAHPAMGRRQWAIWGALAGLMVEVYHLNGVLIVAAIWTWVRSAPATGWRRAIGHGVLFTAAAVVVNAPQLIGKAVVYGHPLVTGYQDQFVWSEPRLWQTALSSNHGWLLWTPVAAVAAWGTVSAWRAHPGLRGILLSCVLFYLAVACYQNWHGQSSFGNRFFVSLSVVLVIGLAAVADGLRRRGGAPLRGFIVLIGALVVWNAGFAFQWGTNIIPNRGPVSFRDVAVNQVTVVPERLAAFVARYVGNRRAVQDDIERDDQMERRAYQVVR